MKLSKLRHHAVLAAGAITLGLAILHPAAVAAEPVTIWSWRTEDQAAMETMFDAFRAKNPDIEVELQFTPDADYQNRLSTALRGGRGPDIAQLKAYGELQPLVDAGYLDALDDSIPELKAFPEAALGGSRAVSDGKIYGVPYSTPVMGVFYNTDIFAEHGIAVPRTYTEFVAACEKLKAAGVLPIAAGGASGSGWALEISLGVIGPTIYGPGFFEEMATGKANFTDPRFVQTLQRMKDLAPFYSEGFSGVDYTTATQQFISGNAAMFFGGAWENGSFKSQNPDLHFSIFPFPTENGNDPAFTSTFSDGSYGLVADSENKDPAITVLRWMASPEFAQLFADSLGWPPARTEATASDPVLKAMLEMQKHSTPYLTLVGFRWQTPTASSVVQAEIIDMIEGKITPEQMAANVNEAVSTWFKPQP